MRYRKPTIILASLALLLCLGVLIAQRLPGMQGSDDLGQVRVYPAWFAQRGFVFLFSDATGWNAADTAAARRLARGGQRVIGIDTPAFLARSARPGAGCLYLPGVLEAYSEAAQRNDDRGAYTEPALAGRGAGGALVYMALVQAPALAFSGGVALDATATLAFTGDFCDQQPVQRVAGRYAIRQVPLAAGVPARLLHSSTGAAAAPDAVVTSGAPAGPGELYERALADIAAHAPQDPLADLPLVELPAAGPPGGPFAILYSGDGGWRDLDRSLAYVLADKGLPVVGVDVLHYYWKVRSPVAAAADLARIIRYYQSAWGRGPVVLIGFSFGANMLPFIVNRLPTALRTQVRLVSLLSPERSTAFEVDPRSWLGIESQRGVLPIGPELARMPHALVQCVYGESEAAVSLCTLPAAAGTRVLRKSGDHHFDGDYARLADEILAAVPVPPSVPPSGPLPGPDSGAR